MYKLALYLLLVIMGCSAVKPVANSTSPYIETERMRTLKESLIERISDAAAQYDSSHRSVPIFISVLDAPNTIEVPVGVATILVTATSGTRHALGELYVSGGFHNSSESNIAALVLMLSSPSRQIYEIADGSNSRPGWVSVRSRTATHRNHISHLGENKRDTGECHSLNP